MARRPEPLHGGTSGKNVSDRMLWDCYKEVCAVQEWQQFPVVGYSIERRTMEHVAQICIDERIPCYVSFACGQIKVHTGGCRSYTRYSAAKLLFELPQRTLQHNFSYETFRTKNCQAHSRISSAIMGVSRNSPSRFANIAICLFVLGTCNLWKPTRLFNRFAHSAGTGLCAEAQDPQSTSNR